MQTKRLPNNYDCLAPDGSEIRLLAATDRASTVHCTLPARKTSLAVAHRSVEEIWYVLEGRGKVWRRLAEWEQVIDVQPGVSLSIPKGAHFQFRNTGDTPLRFLIATMPPWPGEEEAYRVDNYWPVSGEARSG